MKGSQLIVAAHHSQSRTTGHQ